MTNHTGLEMGNKTLMIMPRRTANPSTLTTPRHPSAGRAKRLILNISTLRFTDWSVESTSQGTRVTEARNKTLGNPSRITRK